ncbi:putative hydrolase [Paenarthrobacter nicotinovorans]|uniref:PHP domain-containing protein n=1 Tax=Micrococcaceae TaxID=1268 RepID=UPI0008770E15|nr:MULTISPECIES: PHP domain-containing protein [Micrococcaceae]MDR6437360.1 putative hydrolase [Paenarthrobacter nicotinovorans]SCZ53550.1 putative hydrolase [Arthrobacter sp. UNCCL28]
MDPIEALDEISFWLERSQAPTFKVQAFRKAADAVRQLSPEQLAKLTGSGRITSLKGVGNRSAEVITQALEDRVPDYLADLRERGTESLASGGDTLRAALRGDLHSHSNWSDGGSPIEAMVAAARTLGREYLALTDHSPNLTIANGLSVERLEKQLGVVDGINASSDGFRLLKGIEVDILEDGTLDQTPPMLAQLDVVVASVHSKLRSDKKTMTTRMLGGISDPHTNVLGHCTGRLVQGSRGTRPESEFDAARVFKECAEWGVAVEINSRPERQDPPDNLIAMALDAGCLFSIDSDAHAPGQLDFLQYGAERAERLGVPKERIVTTWPLEQLREWLGLKK